MQPGRMAWGTPGGEVTLKGASGREWTLRFERRLAPRPGLAENPASSVWLVRDVSSNSLHVIKRQSASSSEVEDLISEAAAWRAACLKSDVISELRDVFVNRTEPSCSVSFLSEFCSRGHVPRKQPLSEAVLLTLALDISSAAAACTPSGHGNISYDTVLVDADAHARLCGFGAKRSATIAQNDPNFPLNDGRAIASLLRSFMAGAQGAYSDALYAVLETLESGVSCADAARAAEAAGGVPRAPVVDVSGDTGGGRGISTENSNGDGAISQQDAGVDAAVGALVKGVDAAGAYSAVLGALARTEASAARAIFNTLVRSPLANDGACAMRALTMLHNLFLDAGDSVMEAARGSDKFLDWLEASWTREAVSAAVAEGTRDVTDGFTDGEISAYTSFIRRKARFHMLAAGGFSGAWERTGVTNADRRDVLGGRRRKVLGGMADLSEMVDALVDMLARATDMQMLLKHAALRPLVDEVARSHGAGAALAEEATSVRDAERLAPAVERLWHAAKNVLRNVQGIRAAGAEDWMPVFEGDAPPDIVAAVDARINGVPADAEIAQDMPEAGWEESGQMIGGEDDEDEAAERKRKKKEKKLKKKKEAEEVAAAAAAEKDAEQNEITAADGALVVHGSGDAAAAAVTTLFGDLLQLDGPNDAHPLPPGGSVAITRQPGELTDGEALASAFGAPPPDPTPMPPYDDDGDGDGGYDDFRARQEAQRAAAAPKPSTGAWAARAGYGSGALVVHHTVEQAPNKPHPAFCQCALCQKAEAEDAATAAAMGGYGGGQREDDGYYERRNGYELRPQRGGYDDDDGDSYESVNYSVEENGTGSSPDRGHPAQRVDSAYQPYDAPQQQQHYGGASYGRDSYSGNHPDTPQQPETSIPTKLPKDNVAVMKKLRTGDKIGEGAFGMVYKGEYKREPVAIKKMSKKMVASPNAMAEFSNEVLVMCALSHENVLKCIAACLTPPNVLLVTEFMKRGTLFDVLYKHHIKLTWSMIRKIALQLAKGMTHLHSKGIIHRDLKASNVLVDASYNVKLGDFGLAGPPKPPSPSGVSGTYQYMAPEILSGEPHSFSSDVYAYGLVLCEIISGTPPFFGIDGMQAAEQVLNQNARPPIPQHCLRPYATIIQACWSAAAASRPSFEDVIQRIETTTK